MSIDKKLLILRSLNKQWASTRSLIENNIELYDRSATSLLLNLLKNDELIKKYTNGYWNITDEGRAYLDEHDVESSDETESSLSEDGTDDTSIDSEPVHIGLDMAEGESVNVSIDLTDVAPEKLPEIEMVDPEPAPAPKQIGGTWDFISQIMQQIPEKASFVIENDKAFIVFADSQFDVQASGDVEAVLRAAELYSGRFER